MACGIASLIGNLSMYKGEDKTFEDTIYEMDGVTKQDITGWTVLFMVHLYGNPDVIFISKTVGAGITLTDPTNGVMDIQVDRADTLGMNPDEYEYDVVRTNPGGDAVVSKGLFTLLRL